MAKDLVNNLYKFLKQDVTENQLFEANKKVKVPESKVIDLDLEEGRVPADPSTNPEGYMGELKEKDSDKKSSGEVPPASQTADNKDTKIEKELDKETPEVDKNAALKQQEEQGKGKAGKDQLKSAGTKEVQVTGVAKEGKVPKDPSADNPENKKDLKEALPKEKELTTMSDENAARQLAAKYSGGRVVPDAQGKQFIVMVPESTEVTEDMSTDQKQQVPKTTVDKTINTVGVNTDSSSEASVDAKVQTGSAGPKSVDQQSVPKTDVQADADVDDVKGSADPNMSPDANSKVGSPTKSPAQGQAVPKASVDQGARVDDVAKAPVKEADKDQQAVPKTSVQQGARVDDVKTQEKKMCSSCGKEACECSEDVGYSEADFSGFLKEMSADTSFDQKVNEVTPPGWEGPVKAMKKSKDITNPWALAWWMKNKGYTPHKKESVEEKKKKKITKMTTGVKKVPMKEDAAEVLVKTDDKQVTVVSDETGTTVNTTEAPQEAPIPVGAEPPIEEPSAEETPPEDEEMGDEEITDMAERMLLVGHLKTKPKLTSKEKEFIVRTESRKLSEKNSKLVAEKLALLKNKK